MCSVASTMQGSRSVVFAHADRGVARPRRPTLVGMSDVLPGVLMAAGLDALGLVMLTHRRQSWNLMRRVPGWRQLPDDPQAARGTYVAVAWVWPLWMVVFSTLFLLGSAFLLVSSN